MIYFHEIKFSSQNRHIVVPRIRYCMTCFNKQEDLCLSRQESIKILCNFINWRKPHCIQLSITKPVFVGAWMNIQIWRYSWVSFAYILSFSCCLILPFHYSPQKFHFQVSEDVCLLWKWQNFLMLSWNLCSIYLLQ